MPKPRRKLDFSALTNGMPGLDCDKARDLVTAACVCLDHNRHRSGVRLVVTGDIRRARSILFDSPSEQQRATHADLEEATELGASAVAIVVVCAETGLDVVGRARKKTGIDYWLGHVRGEFRARLEVSGILNGTDREIRRRLARKLSQMEQSDATDLPGHAVVVEFNRPRAHVESK